MDIKAHANYLRMSPRRMRLVADVVRGLPVARAEAQLLGIHRRATLPLTKLLQSAVANAEQNFDCMRENLYVKTIIVNEGAALKRSTPRAFGRATPIRKRSLHMTIVLGELDEGKRGGRARRETARTERHGSHLHKKRVAQPEEGSAGKNAETASAHRPPATIPGRMATRHHVEGAKENVHGPQKKSRGFLKRLFNRKAV